METTEIVSEHTGDGDLPAIGDARVCIIPNLLVEKEERAANTGTKVFPICNDADMKDLSTSTEELRSLCFPASFSLIEAQLEVVPPGATSASFSSHSTGTVSKHGMYSGTDSHASDGMLAQLMQKSAAFNETVTKLTKSRHGRSGQRWIVDSHSNNVIRLVTGCIPILKGGKIMMVSASKKNEWILPKGGWEMDEDIEESAIRETYEEAGVIGVLGPKLSEIQYETRKARQRRLSLAERLLKSKLGSETKFSSGWSDVSQLSEDDHISGEKDEPSSDSLITHQTAQSPETTGKPNIQIGTTQAAAANKDIPSEMPMHNLVESHAQTDTHLVRESPSEVYTHICANMFPLYVKEVMASWPECGRLRKAVDIDEAIELLAKRPEMQSMLQDLKANGLHKV